MTDEKFILLSFQVLAAVSMKMTIIWDVALCNLVAVYLI